MPYAPRAHQPRHQTARPQRVDRRASASERGYDSRWTKLRAAYVAQHPLCEDCIAEGRTMAVHEVDHIIPINGINDPLRLMWDNLRSRCRSHHASKTRQDERIRAEYEASGDAAAVIGRWVAMWS
jgi:5-methylcytosine-specific restriction protein A